MMANVAVAHAGPAQLSNKERRVLDHVRAHVFKPLKGKEHWEGVEVAAYWAAVGKRVVLREVYGREAGNSIAAAARGAAAGPVVVVATAGAVCSRRNKRQRV
jgi:hypothetical protein